MENEEYQKEQRRALNIIWTAAEDYSFRPDFMSFDQNGHAVFYLNIIIGCTQKWFGHELVEEKAADFAGAARRELYDTVLWLCLESCVYKKEFPVRPAMKGLREEYAGKLLEEEEKILEPSLTLTLQTGHFKRVLGQTPSVTLRERQLLDAMDLDGTLTKDQVQAAVDKILRDFFKFSSAPAVRRNGKTIRFPGLGLIRKLHLIPAIAVRTEDMDWEKMLMDSGPEQEKRSGKSALYLEPSGHESYDKKYIEICYGPSLYGEKEIHGLERELCTGSHQNCRLYFAGERAADAGEALAGRECTGQNGWRNRDKAGDGMPEAYRQKRRFLDQEEKNRAYYDSRKGLFGNCIRQLKNRLLDAVLSGEEPETARGTAGNLDGGLVFRGLYLDDNRIFLRNRQEEREPFSVDIMLDGSASQLERQEIIAAEAYVIAESLRQCGIPVQVYSFCSLRGYTVFRMFRKYGQEDGNRNIFQYAAAGWNRDGLALKGAGSLMDQSPCRKRVLLVLTDASPNDEKRLAAKGRVPVGKEYAKAAGIQDAAGEVRNLKKKGIRVIGLFCGQDSDLNGAGKIYGGSFARITGMGQLAGIVGGLILREVLRED